MTKLNPYLTFEGNCEEAFNFYRKAFRREFKFLGRYKDVPDTDRQIFKEDDDKIPPKEKPEKEITDKMSARRNRGASSSNLDYGDRASIGLFTGAIAAQRVQAEQLQELRQAVRELRGIHQEVREE